jgi:hypothetical protein
MKALIASRQHLLSLAVCLLVSLAVWLVFYPTVFSLDTFLVLLDATTGRFSDVHPLLLPVTLWLVLKAGGSISFVTFGQIVLGFLGIRRLVLVLVRYFGMEQARTGDWLVVAILVLLAAPLSPFSIYLATLWPDTWLSIFLLWIVALLFELDEHSKDAGSSAVGIAAIVLLAALIILVRYNAIVMYPFLAFSFFGVLRRRSFSVLRSASLVSIPLFLAAGFLAVQSRTPEIEQLHPERAVYALDLASMIKFEPSICQDLSLESCDLVVNEFIPEFRVGDGAIDLTFNQGHAVQYDPFVQLFHSPRLEKELWMAAVDHPALYLTVKLLNYLDYVRPDPNQFFFHRGAVLRDRTRLPYQTFASPDNLWFSAAVSVFVDPLLSWYSYVHAVWLVINLLGVIAMGGLAYGRKDHCLLFLCQILLIPAAYYSGYLIALTTREFRFMYPSMLITQVITLTLLLGAATRRLIPGCASRSRTASGIS